MAEDQFGRDFHRNILAALFQHHHQLALIVIIEGEAGIADRAAAGHHHIGLFGEEQRRLLGIIAKLLGMGGVIAPHAPDPAHGKPLVVAMDGDEWLRQGKKIIVGHGCSLIELRIAGIPKSPLSPPLRRCAAPPRYWPGMDRTPCGRRESGGGNPRHHGWARWARFGATWPRFLPLRDRRNRLQKFQTVWRGSPRRPEKAHGTNPSPPPIPTNCATGSAVKDGWCRRRPRRRSRHGKF